ncbi:MAG: zinc-binding alcohol dehydrogenase [Candidatus Poribacteria bacterium]|jgi:2-desacetyl-2-hydroxyethyl bacteriochlorophyllide A dehydrogenase|nr:zinc-binding alcohol dehydrogenase [Candidatus Poribacteria bacterium]MDP6749805.1 zinc-binding alcohol dehydrogenase [Candidatus Poribacteria bacterium]MDP6998144.1 zinc-binding alcohol dehydrogenase [Candidatus Poribacteria bacterium]
MAISPIPKYGHRLLVRPDNTVEIGTFEVDLPSSQQVLIETDSTLISAGTELGTQEQDRQQPFTPGYSNAGRILALGDGVEGYQVGDRVLSLGHHASHVTVSDAPQSLVKLPDGASFAAGTFGVLGSVSIHGVRKAKLEFGERLMITGMGVVGQLALQLAKLTGCDQAIAVDLIDQRLEKADISGATHILNPTTCDLKSQVQQLTEGRGLDVVIEASGYPDLLPELFDLMRIGGRIVLLGSIWHRKVELDLMPFHEKELIMIGAHQPKCPTTPTAIFPWTQQYNRAQILKYICQGTLNVDHLISHQLPYTEAETAYRLLRDQRDQSLGVILKWGT